MTAPSTPTPSTERPFVRVILLYATGQYAHVAEFVGKVQLVGEPAPQFRVFIDRDQRDADVVLVCRTPRCLIYEELVPEALADPEGVAHTEA